MLVKDREITETEILRICREREEEENVIYYSFEEAYKIGLEYIPKI